MFCCGSGSDDGSSRGSRNSRASRNSHGNRRIGSVRYGTALVGRRVRASSGSVVWAGPGSIARETLNGRPPLSRTGSALGRAVPGAWDERGDEFLPMGLERGGTALGESVPGGDGTPVGGNRVGAGGYC